MRRRIVASTVIIACFTLVSCHTRGIIELSRADAQRCDRMVARDGELLIALMSAVNDFLGNVSGSEQNLQDVRAQCTEHLMGWDQFVTELYQKYGINEEVYRLDVFRGSFSPKVMGEGTAPNKQTALRSAIQILNNPKWPSRAIQDPKSKIIQNLDPKSSCNRQ